MAPMRGLSNRPGLVEPSDWDPRVESFYTYLTRIVVLALVYIFLVVIVCFFASLGALQGTDIHVLDKAFSIMTGVGAGIVCLCLIAMGCVKCILRMRNKRVM